MENIETKDYGEISVQVAPIGQYTGSDRDGNPIPENLTEEALSSLAEKLNSGDEILCDIDHASCRVGADKDSSAAGWFSKFVVQPLKGLFATLRFTKRGKELAENREYRYLSPTFMLDENGIPVDVHSISYTNTPAFKGHINPIINSEAKTISNETKDILDMTIEELKQLIVDTISETKASEKAEEVKEEIKEEVKEEAVENEETAEKPAEETAEKPAEETAEKPAEETAEAVKNEEVTEEEKKEEEKKEDEKAEVIKLEALNSSPNISITSEPEWKKLKGKEFFDWLAKHPRG